MPDAPFLLWFRRDLRLADHPMLTAAATTGRPVVPVFILDPETEALGAASKWRLGEALLVFARSLEAKGLRLLLRRGLAVDTVLQLVEDTGAAGVMWSRAYDPDSKARDTEVKAALKRKGLIGESHPGHLLHEPWTVETGQGGYYRVYTPYWKAVRDRDVPAPLPVPSLRPPNAWPSSDRLQDWHLGAAMNRGAAVIAPHAAVGEVAAERRLADFLDGPVEDYSEARNIPARPATSRLSENLTWGEIGIRHVWHAVKAMLEAGGGRGTEHFLKELVWREFAWHLMHHTPHIATRNWREEWDSFPWRADNADAERWRQGMTGEPLVDAAMREMYVTGTMHNRGRMIVASYLTKHLMTDWRVGAAWFDDCLIDWDAASNAMGWQWAAGSGPDAAPYFRIFNPATQAETYDPKSTYRRRWIAEGAREPAPEAMSYFYAVPRAWGLDPALPYPQPLVGLAEGRERALAAYSARNS